MVTDRSLAYTYCFIGWLGRETGYGSMDQSAGVLWIVSGALFLRSSRIHPNLSASHEGLLYVDHVRYIWSWTICGLSVESVWRVGRIFPAWCTSIQIAATLGYE
jgi:hypothetical protein